MNELDRAAALARVVQRRTLLRLAVANSAYRRLLLFVRHTGRHTHVFGFKFIPRSCRTNFCLQRTMSNKADLSASKERARATNRVAGVLIF